MKPQRFTSFHNVLVPMIHGCTSQAALDAARLLDAEIMVVGLVPVDSGVSLSHGAACAREMRKAIRAQMGDGRIRPKPQVLVSHSPWQDLLAMIADDEPDLLLLEWNTHFKALNISPADALSRPPCNVALVRGPFQPGTQRILIPVRGGPHAELALRLGLSIRERQVTALHMLPRGDETEIDPSFRGLQRVLSQMADVQKRVRTTADPAQAILEEAASQDLIILGTTAQPMTSSISLGPVADRILQETGPAVMAVKNRRPVPHAFTDEAVGAQAISILVDKWFAENTFAADEFADLKQLVALKERLGVSISLALPALDEEETVGRVIRIIRRVLMKRYPLLDEIVLVDSLSTDRTREIARSLGIPVFIHQEILPELGARTGKGEALWKSLLVTRGDILAWIDTDIVNIHPRFVYGILGPLLHNPNVQFVKGFYRRPLRVSGKIQAGGGGRVTELVARPLINLFYPELSGIVQLRRGDRSADRRLRAVRPFGHRPGGPARAHPSQPAAGGAEQDVLHHPAGLPAQAGAALRPADGGGREQDHETDPPRRGRLLPRRGGDRGGGTASDDHDPAIPGTPLIPPESHPMLQAPLPPDLPADATDG
jgi:glucosyl-3-phosphoglycerate synthase